MFIIIPVLFYNFIGSDLYLNVKLFKLHFKRTFKVIGQIIHKYFSVNEDKNSVLTDSLQFLKKFYINEQTYYLKLKN